MANAKKNIEKMLEPKNRLSRKRSQKEFEELLLRDILIELETGESDYWDQKAIEWADEPGRAPSTEQRAAFEEQLDLEVKRIQKQKRQIAQARSARRKRALRVLRKGATVAAVLMIFIGMTLYHTVDAFAAGVDRFIATVVPTEGAEELRIEEKKDKGQELDLDEYIGMYRPSWIPKGYQAHSVKMGSNGKQLIYVNKENDRICFEISKRMYSVLVDDEEVVEENIYLHDSQGRIVVAEDMVYVIWEDGDYLYTVSGSFTLQDELIKMAEECIKVEN